MKQHVFGFLAAVFAMGLPGAAVAADVSYYGVVKSAQYEQTNDGLGVLLATNAFGFNAFAVATTNNVLTNATVSPPLHTLLPDLTNGTAFMYTEPFDTQSALDAAYPAGSVFTPANYTVTMYTTNDGVKSGSLTFFLLFSALSYPTTPHVTNFAAAQAIDTTRDFELGWSSLGGSALAIVHLTILDTASNLVYMTPAPFQPGALSGASVSALIPAGTLPPGTNLIGHLSIANPGMPNTTAYSGATGIAALAKDTQFSLATRPAPASPRLFVLPPEGESFALRLEGEPDRVYGIEATPDCRSWTNLFTTNSLNGCFNYTDTNSKACPWRMYRGKIGQ